MKIHRISYLWKNKTSVLLNRKFSHSWEGRIGYSSSGPRFIVYPDGEAGINIASYCSGSSILHFPCSYMLLDVVNPFGLVHPWIGAF